MEKTKKTLNLIALIGFLVSNFLTPLSYAVAEREFPQTDSNSESQQGADVLSEEGNSTTDVEQISKIEELSFDKGASNTNVDTAPELMNGEAEGLNEGEEIPSAEAVSPLSKGEQNASLINEETQKVLGESDNDEDAEDLPELTPLEKGPMLKSAGNTQLNWTEGVDFHTISIAKPAGVTDEGPAGFTIMDRNLGATGNEVDTTHGSYTNGTGSYGYHYQWGNNYGFSQGCTITSQYGSCSDEIVPDTNGLSWDSGYNNSGYYSTAFINGNNFDYDVRDDSSHHDGLRGGAADSSDNNRGANETNPEDRQGPCPDGYHVPSAGEWGLLIKYWAYASGYNSLVNGSEGLYYIDDTTARTNFMEYFKLPFAGFRGYFNAFLNGQGSDGIYWSSSPYGSDDPNRRARRLYLGSSLVRADDYEYRAHGYSVRCFKDTYEVPSTYIVRFLDDGIEIDSGAVTQGGLRSEEVPTPEQREGYDFDYRYADGENSEFDFTAPITENTTLHAKWTFTAIIPNGIYTGLNGGDITVVWSDDMRGDINLTLAGDNLEGYYYRGWNEMADNNWSMNPTNGENYNNNRGGGGDTYDNGFDDGNERYKRQGPCPEGYHIPSRGEWNTLAIAWCNIDTGCNARYSDVQIGGVSGHLIKVTGNNAWTESNKLIFVSNLGWGTKFKTAFNMLSSDEDFWSSSPDLDDNDRAWELYVLGHYISPDSTYGRNNDIRVRCFKNYLTIPTITYTLELHTNGGDVAEEELETDSEGKVTLPNATREDASGEWIFEGWFASTGESEKIGNSGDEITLTADMDVYAHWAQTITIRDPENPLSGFTIMDRNLGAITDDISSTGSYGFHYQWGNNYGFLQSLDKTANPEYFSGTRATYEGYGPANPYSDSVFRMGSSMYDYWELSHYNNLWGGIHDGSNNNRGANETNPTDRQGPCPSGYHVPSVGEWGLLVKYWAYASGYYSLVNGSEGLYYINDTTARTNFMEYFKLPFAGIRGYNDASLSYQGGIGVYWSSSHNKRGSDCASNLFLDSSYVSTSFDLVYRAIGQSLRCFKDTYEAPISTYSLTFDSQSGSEVASRYTIPDQPRSRPANPTRDGYTFVDWYTSTGYETVFDFSTPATGDLTVYAKWQKSCEAGETYYEELGECATRDTNNIVYYRTDENGKDVISIISGDTILTMLDKNEGASVAGTGEDSYGELYQRGHNAPIKTAPTSTGRAEYENYRPGHSFYDATFRYGGSMHDYWQNNIHYNNLWGGSGDDTAGDWGGINNGDTRQGPCDTGYHVPSIMEWNTVLQMFASSVGQNLSGTTLHNFTNSTTNAGKFRNAFKLPFAGYYDSYGASIYNYAFGRYWSSSPYSANDSAHFLNLNSSSVNANSNNWRAEGLSVRCFKDSPNASQTLILTFDINGGELSGADSEGKLIQKVESGKLPQEPVKYARDGYDFEGWYTSTGYETGFDFSTPLAEDMTVYAKWDEVYTITYNLDGGTESLPNPTTYTVESGTFGLYQPTKSGYMFLGWTGSNGDTPNANIYITGGNTGNKTYNAVWGTFEDIDAYFISSTGAISYITLMDRNMGASMTGAGASASTGSYGFHYQWGNNNGFQIGCWEYDCSDTVTENAIGTKAVWNNSYNNKGYNGTMFITGSDDYWEGNQHYAGLWGGSGDNSNNNWGLDTITSSNITNRQGPCPDGYHVPSAGEWDILLKNRANVYIGEGNTLNNWTMDDSMNGFYQDTTGTKLFYEMFDISFPGWRGFTDATIVDVRNTEEFLSSSYNSDSLVDISFVDGVIVSFLGVHHANGYSVRCFSNDYLFTQPSMTIDAKGGTGAMILVEADTIKSLGTPHRANSIFSGWYDADTQGNKIETGNDAPTNLYARWSCEEGYIEVNDECVQAFTVIFDANTNGGTTTTGEELIASGTVLELSNYTATKTGWIFTGWNTDSGATEPMPNLTVTGATTLYAIFSKTLTVTYATGTGVSEISQNSDNCTLYNTDASCTVVAPDITLSEGYATGVWSNGVYTLNPGEDITLTEDDTYTAIASAIKYSIAYNLDGGTITGSNPEEYTIESGFTLINPTKDDYVFVGWIGTNISIPTITVVVPVGTTGNLSYTANWEEDFNHNGEADSTEVKKVVEFLSGDHGTLLGTTRYEILPGLTLLSTGYVEPTKVANSGYVFSGWDKVIDTTSPIISDITYTAIWGEDKNGNGINDEREDHFDVEFTGGENGTLSGETIWPEILTGLTIDEAGITIPEVIPNSGYVFSGWEPEITGGTVITSGLTVTPIYGEDKNGNGINDEFETKYKVTVNYVYSRGGQASPSVSGMYLSGIAFNYVSPNIQYYTANSGTVSGTGIEQDQIFTVIYTPNIDKNNNGIADEIDGYKPGGGGSGGGGGGGSSSQSNTGSAGGTGSQINSNTGDIASSGANNQQPNNTTGSNIQTGNQTPQNNISTGTEVKDIEIIPANTPGNSQGGESYSPEFQQAYKFAKQNGITTMPTIQKADMDGNLTRIAMAKMLSQYAINVLGMKPDESKNNKFDDVSDKKNSDYDNGVTLAYQLGIMGQNMPNNNFRPNDEVTRAEFATALSRMIYKTSDGVYKSTPEYYVNHMNKLKEEGIITKADPKMKELRGYVMIMLMRSAK